MTTGPSPAPLSLLLSGAGLQSFPVGAVSLLVPYDGTRTRALAPATTIDRPAAQRADPRRGVHVTRVLSPPRPDVGGLGTRACFRFSNSSTTLRPRVKVRRTEPEVAELSVRCRLVEGAGRSFGARGHAVDDGLALLAHDALPLSCWRRRRSRCRLAAAAFWCAGLQYTCFVSPLKVTSQNGQTFSSERFAQRRRASARAAVLMPLV